VHDLDGWLAQVGAGSATMALLVAFLLGLRHATDPDHLAAVSTLVLGDGGERARRAGGLGLAWGIGHGGTLVALGLPVVLFGHYLPEPVHRGAEFAVGIIIVVLAVRLLQRWQGGLWLESGASGASGAAALLPREGDRSRSPLSAFGIGLLHGIGGSAGAGILLVTAHGDRRQAAWALLIFAGASALSMAIVSGAFGYALARGPITRSLAAVTPVFGLGTLAFGVWYALSALEVGF
jgi:hypothetical protein